MKLSIYFTSMVLNIVFLLVSDLLAQGDIRGSVTIFPANDIQVSLINQSGVVVNRTTTDNSGQYDFRSVSAGNYKLEFSCDYIKTATTNSFFVPPSGMPRGAEPLLNHYNTPGMITFRGR